MEQQDLNLNPEAEGQEKKGKKFDKVKKAAGVAGKYAGAAAVGAGAAFGVNAAMAHSSEEDAAEATNAPAATNATQNTEPTHDDTPGRPEEITDFNPDDIMIEGVEEIDNVDVQEIAQNITNGDEIQPVVAQNVVEEDDIEIFINDPEPAIAVTDIDDIDIDIDPEPFIDDPGICGMPNLTLQEELQNDEELLADNNPDFMDDILA